LGLHSQLQKKLKFVLETPASNRNSNLDAAQSQQQ